MAARWGNTSATRGYTFHATKARSAAHANSVVSKIAHQILRRCHLIGTRKLVRRWTLHFRRRRPIPARPRSHSSTDSRLKRKSEPILKTGSPSSLISRKMVVRWTRSIAAVSFTVSTLSIKSRSLHLTICFEKLQARICVLWTISFAI